MAALAASDGPRGRPRRRLARALAQPGPRHAAPLLLLLLLGFAVPLALVIAFSFIEPRTFDLWSRPTLTNYQTIVSETFYLSFLWSLGLAVTAVVLLVVICYPLAYALAKVFGRWTNLLTLFLVIPLFVSENVRLYGWFIFFIKKGVLLGTIEALTGVELAGPLFTLPAIVFGLVYVYLPFMLFPMTLGLSMVPREMTEAAGDLGATRLQVFREVELPLAMPGIVIGCLLTFVLAVGALSEAKILGGQAVIVLVHDIIINFTYAQNWPLGSALSVLMILLVGGLVVLVLRRFDLDVILGRR